MVPVVVLLAGTEEVAANWIAAAAPYTLIVTDTSFVPLMLAVTTDGPDAVAKKLPLLSTVPFLSTEYATLSFAVTPETVTLAVPPIARLDASDAIAGFGVVVAIAVNVASTSALRFAAAV